jgi:hypothetical protein
MLIALSTGPTSYHLCVLILAAALALASLFELGRKHQAYTLGALYAAVCFPLAKLSSRNADGWHILLASPRLYPMLFLFIATSVFLFQSDSTLERACRTRRDFALFAAGAILLWSVGSTQSVIHLRGAFATYPDRVLNYPQSVLKGEPAVGADGIYFARMPGQVPGFQLSRWNGELTNPLIPAKDQFHPATSPTLHEVWLEDGGPTSNILRISNDSMGEASASHLEVANGEQPSVSPDCKWLLFIRETKGRGALWIKALSQPARSEDSRERRLIEDSYDVWEAAFEPGDQPELYSFDLNSGKISPLPIPGPVRYPAISPDGKWIAYSQFEGDIWRLYVARLGSGEPHRVTQADCNSISPAWEADSKGLIYASDCGRGLEMTTLVRARFDAAGFRHLPPVRPRT